MAATRLIALHVNKGKTVAQCLADRTDYSENAAKTNNGEFISSYECDAKTADEEFLLSKRQYQHITGRQQKNNIIAYQIRQSVKPGEVTPEEANQVGYETAMRFTKGKHAFIVATHIDKAHIHNHIIYNSTTLDCTRKFKNFFLSGLAVQKVSDLVCAEHGLSIITPKPYRERQKRTVYPKKRTQRDDLCDAIDQVLQEKPRNYADFLKKMEVLGFEFKDGKQPAFRGKGQKRFIRLRSLGEDYSDEELRAAITVCLLKEKGLDSYEDLVALTEKLSSRFSELSSSIKSAEKRMVEIGALQTHLNNYSKTRKVYEAYRKSGYSKKFFEEHRESITLHKAAKEAFNKTENGKAPSRKALDEEFHRLLTEKKQAYAEYREVKKDMQEYLIAKQTVEHILGIDRKKQEEEKKQQREEQR